MTNERKRELLNKPNWSYKDIAEYVGCKTTKACEIKKIAVNEYDGAIRYLPDYVKRDSVLAWLGTTKENELKI